MQVEAGADELTAVAPKLDSLIDRAGNFQTNVLLFSLSLVVLRRRFGLDANEAMSTISSFAHKLADMKGYGGDTCLQFSDLFERDFDNTFEAATNLFPDLEEMLCELSSPGTTMYLVASQAVAFADSFNITVESLVEVIRESGARFEQMAEERGLFDDEKAAAAIQPHISVQTYRACIKLMDAAAQDGREGFMAYVESSPYLRKPSGFTLRKHVAHTDLPGMHGPVSGEVTASFTSLGTCKGVYALFRGNKLDLLGLREATCETFAQIYGAPAYADERRAEWAFRHDDCKGRYTVELEEEFREWHLRVSLEMKRFW
jgi:hypothetical protein